MAILIKTDGTKVDIVPRSGKKFLLKELQMYVDGYIEMVRIPTEIHPDCIILVNEEGLIMGLPKNSVASKIAKQHLVGDAVIIYEGGI